MVLKGVDKMKKLKNLNHENFEGVVSSGLSLIDFYADWCPPCKAYAPKFDEFAEKYSEKMTVAKVNVDQNKELARKYNVRSVPTTIMIKDGKEVERLGGNVSSAELEALVLRTEDV